MSPLELTPRDAGELLANGEMDVRGRMRWASNATFLVSVSGDGHELPAVYKPRRGERPLWDFPEGTLCRREVASYELSAALGWGIVPESVLRDGPLGEGMVQRFVEHDPEEHYFTLLGDHADRFRRFAVFDVLANNADRKGGHCLRALDAAEPDGDDAIVGIDHGLTFHSAWKLRTVIWDFAGEPIAPPIADEVCRVVTDLDGALGARLRVLLSPVEMDALLQRAQVLVRDGTLPEPDPGYHSVPWPLV
jgi:uncharacterized repeat protein (TIGR03843 family)